MYPIATLACALALAASVPASPFAGRDSGDVANDWDRLGCAELAVIFARGTFDSGNIGPWVGQPFREALYSTIGADKVSFQGVSPQDYPANLDGYIEDGGPESCAVSLANAVEQYSARCPSAKIVISGWSQGALCAHKSLHALATPHARGRLIALVTFGDPVPAWSDTLRLPPPPPSARPLSYCEADGAPDPLCADPVPDWPRSPRAFVDKLEAVWREFRDAELTAAQRAAVGDLVVQLAGQAKSKIGKLGRDILAGHARRWMLTPQHFLYGLGWHPITARAAEDIARVFQQSK